MPYKDKERQRVANKAHTDSLRDWVRELKTARGCSLCGYNRHPDALEFHHASNDKVGCIAKLVARNFSKANLLKEIEKCILVCANCHRVLHARED